MKLSLQNLLGIKSTLAILMLMCFAAINLQAQTVTCPAATDLGTFDCTNITTESSDVPGPPGTVEEAMAAPYNIGIDGADASTRISTDDSGTIFYCDTDDRTVTRTVIVYVDANFNFVYDVGEEVGMCDFTINTVPDVTAPSFEAPTEFIANCVDGYEPDIAGDVMVVIDESCPVITVSDYVFFADAEADGRCMGELIVTRSWTAVDPCGNTSEPQTQMIVVMDTEGPVFTLPGDATLDCSDDPNDIALTGTVTDASDVCDPSDIQVNGIIVPDLTQENTPCPGSTTYTKRWGAVDDCGNATTMDQMIVTSDTTPPEFEVPADATVACGDELPAAADITAVDDCDPNGLVAVFEGSVVTPDGAADCEARTMVRTWTATDGCGNVTTKTQTLMLEACIPTCNDDPCVGDITTLAADGCNCDLVTAQVIDCTNPDASNFNPAANCECDATGIAPGANECCLLNFDLALVKELTSVGPFTIGTGATVTFTITVSNQGDVTAQNIEITDYIPTGLILADANWTQAGTSATTTIAGPLVAGASASVDITFEIDPTVMPGSYTNFAEISAAEDENGDPGMDSDSTPDNDPDNDGDVTDNEIDNANGDEDDHDGATFTLACATPTCNADPCVGDVTALSADGCSCDLVTPQVLGCTDAAACNFDAAANCDDGSCQAVPVCNDDPCVGDITALDANGCACELVTPQVLGCTDAAACNFDAAANCDDGSCMAVPTCNTDPCVGDIEELSANECDCVVVTPQVLGCTDPEALNYDSNANCDDGSCVDKVFDLSLDKSIVTAGPYAPGQDVTYTITVTNEGNIPAQNISIADDVPSALTFNAALSPGWTFTGADITTTIAGPLAPGASASVNLTFTINANAAEGSITNTAQITGAEDENGDMVADVDSTPGNNDPTEDDQDDETISVMCPDDAGQMGSALKSVCGGENVSAPAEGVVTSAGSIHTYLLHDGTGSIIYDSSSNGNFINDGIYPTNIQLYISSAVGPPGPDGIPDLSSTCSDVVLPGCPVIFYDPISINHYVDCQETTGTLTVNFSITGGGPSATGGTYSVTGSYNGTVSPGQQYIVDGITDGSTYSITVVNDGKGCTGSINEGPVNCTKTPIELISFEGEAQQSGNLLKWVTASEIENDYYTLERASVDMNFVNVNQQQGAGTYSTPSKYTYLDREARNGLSYYRLTQTDFDGTSVIVGMVELQRSEATFEIINIHPIPVLDNFDLFIDSEENQTIEIQVINSIGELMIQKEVELTNAVNKVEVNVSSLAGGVYVISAVAGENTVSQKIIKY